MSRNSIYCRETGVEIAVLLDGGVCLCPVGECCLRDECSHVAHHRKTVSERSQVEDDKS